MNVGYVLEWETLSGIFFTKQKAIDYVVSTVKEFCECNIPVQLIWTDVVTKEDGLRRFNFKCIWEDGEEKNYFIDEKRVVDY